MADRPPVSVLLPTTSWTDACGELAAQLKDHDKLLIIHDVEDDPITDRQHTPEGVRLIAAGEPEHCSGTANAIATGMEAARHDRLVWTDDDFHHPRLPGHPQCRLREAWTGVGGAVLRWTGPAVGRTRTVYASAGSLGVRRMKVMVIHDSESWRNP